MSPPSKSFAPVLGPKTRYHPNEVQDLPPESPISVDHHEAREEEHHGIAPIYNEKTKHNHKVKIDVRKFDASSNASNVQDFATECNKDL